MNQGLNLLLAHLLPLLGQHHLDELLVVDVALAVLFAMNQGLNLLLAHLLPQPSEQVAELYGGDETVPLLVKVLQALDEVVYSVPDGLAGDILQHRQEHFKSHTSVLLILRDGGLDELLDLALSGIGSQGSEHLTHLGHLDQTIPLGVEQLEDLLEVLNLVLSEALVLR